MNCPNCKEPMEAEHSPLVISSSYEHYRRTGEETAQVPSSNYYCGGCDSEWVWIKGVKGIRQIDGRDYEGPRV